MPLTIKIGRENQTAVIRLELDMRKSMSGDLLIFDHGDIDIVISPSKNKVLAFPKETMTELSYGAQNRLFTRLRKKGLVIPESIIASSFCGAFEATMEQPFKEDLNTARVLVLWRV
jgi:hypothetical protein